MFLIQSKATAFVKKLILDYATIFRFHNALKLFPDVGTSRQFAVNIYSKPKEELGFDLISNLYLPKTIDASYLHSGSGGHPRYQRQKEPIQHFASQSTCNQDKSFDSSRFRGSRQSSRTAAVQSSDIGITFY